LIWNGVIENGVPGLQVGADGVTKEKRTRVGTDYLYYNCMDVNILAPQGAARRSNESHNTDKKKKKKKKKKRKK
jgi:hypothetical protein